MSGMFITFWLIGQKMYGLHLGVEVREITDQPLFFLALVAVVCGTQMFLAGFLGEMIHLNAKKDDYLIKKEIG